MAEYIIINHNKNRSYRQMINEAKATAPKNKKQKKKWQKKIRTPEEKALRRAAKALRRVAKLKYTRENPPSPRHYYLYALELEHGMYYVGMTAYKDAARRYEQHVNGHGARWTKLHKPISMIEVRDIGVCMTKTANEAEMLMTREYMEKYGMYKVRGGDLCYIKDALVALHYNDHGAKTVLYDPNGRKIPRSNNHIRRVERVQEQIASELSWIV